MVGPASTREERNKVDPYRRRRTNVGVCYGEAEWGNSSGLLEVLQTAQIWVLIGVQATHWEVGVRTRRGESKRVQQGGG